MNMKVGWVMGRVGQKPVDGGLVARHCITHRFELFGGVRRAELGGISRKCLICPRRRMPD
ncbi:protein of unknown function [Methylocaldum szegediense]|uniref:Uncharacterized protein n=1 Tax=Methylocaldum szegediense TaxID=73780 RepID=A0ABM9I4D6_9GAMM|nr:protein of unknown function [Methylocaldum szegediense]